MATIWSPEHKIVLERVQPDELLGQLDRALQEDRAGVDAVVDEMHGDTGHFHAALECLRLWRHRRNG